MAFSVFPCSNKKCNSLRSGLINISADEGLDNPLYMATKNDFMSTPFISHWTGQNSHFELLYTGVPSMWIVSSRTFGHFFLLQISINLFSNPPCQYCPEPILIPSKFLGVFRRVLASFGNELWPLSFKIVSNSLKANNRMLFFTAHFRSLKSSVLMYANTSKSNS